MKKKTITSLQTYIIYWKIFLDNFYDIYVIAPNWEKVSSEEVDPHSRNQTT